MVVWILYILLIMEIDNRLYVMINIIFFRIFLYFFIRSIIMPLYIVITIVCRRCELIHIISLIDWLWNTGKKEEYVIVKKNLT